MSLAPCCTDTSSNTTSQIPCPCTESNSGGTCWNVIGQYMDQALKLAGGIGLFFSFTEVCSSKVPVFVQFPQNEHQLWK